MVVVDNVSNDGSHGNATVLALDGTTALEGLRLGFHPSERVKDTKGLGGSKLQLVDVQGGGQKNQFMYCIALHSSDVDDVDGSNDKDDNGGVDDVEDIVVTMVDGWMDESMNGGEHNNRRNGDR